MKALQPVYRGVVIAVAIIASGCATILNEETQSINVTSSTGEAFSFSVDGQTYEGPSIVSVKRAKADKFIVTETEGCNKQTLVPAKVDSKFWINILTGGVFGSTTDYSSEEMWAYDANVVVSCKN